MREVQLDLIHFVLLRNSILTSIKQWPKQERPREKLIQQGADSLADSELLAIFLRTGCQGTDVVTLSRQLLTEFGSLRALFSLKIDNFS